MKINKVTITGADNKVFASDLFSLQVDYPFVEWGILFSKSKEGQQRYPSSDQIRRFVLNGLNLSAHFCGWWSNQVLKSNNFDLITQLHPNYKRVQLNYNFAHYGHFDFRPLFNYCNYKFLDRSIILQANQSNLIVHDIAKRSDKCPGNLHFLWDSSGGRGKEIKSINYPYENYTGYSGGINIENIHDICNLITNSPDDDEVWIDMESGVRTNNEFDLNKVEQILKACREFVS